jgi:hypothetical protein
LFGSFLITYNWSRIYHEWKSSEFRRQPLGGSALCWTDCPFNRTERRWPDADPVGVAAARRPERRSGVMLTIRGLGVFRGVALPAARWLAAEAMSLSSPAQRCRPSISIRACTRAKNQWCGAAEIPHPVEIESGEDACALPCSRRCGRRGCSRSRTLRWASPWQRLPSFGGGGGGGCGLWWMVLADWGQGFWTFGSGGRWLSADQTVSNVGSSNGRKVTNFKRLYWKTCIRHTPSFPKYLHLLISAFHIDHLSYSKKLWKYYLFCYDMFYHHIYFNYIIIIFTFHNFFWIRRMVKHNVQKLKGANILGRRKCLCIFFGQYICTFF